MTTERTLLPVNAEVPNDVMTPTVPVASTYVADRGHVVPEVCEGGCRREGVKATAQQTTLHNVQ